MTPNARARLTARAVLAGGMLITILTSTSVTVALPSIQATLRLSAPALAWVVSAYGVAFAACLLPAGRAGDVIGARRTFRAGVLLFTLSSLASGLARSGDQLLTARTLQGVGAAVVAAVSLGMTVAFDAGTASRAKGIGIYASVSVLGAAAGLVLGGALATVGWQWIFFANVPVGLAIFIAARCLAPDDQRRVSTSRDTSGAVLVVTATALAAGTLAAVTAAPSSQLTIALGTAAVLAFGALAYREAHAARPLVPFHLASPVLIVQALMEASWVGAVVVCSLWLQRALGYSALRAGAALLPIVACDAAASVLLSPRLVARSGARRAALPGLALLAAGLIWLTVAPSGPYVITFLPALLLCGTGSAVAWTALVSLAVADSTHAETGVASALTQTAMQLGGSAGVTVLSALAAARTTGLIHAGRPAAVALADGYRAACGVSAAAVLAALLLAACLPPRRRPPRAV